MSFPKIAFLVLWAVLLSAFFAFFFFINNFNKFNARTETLNLSSVSFHVCSANEVARAADILCTATHLLAESAVSAALRETGFTASAKGYLLRARKDASHGSERPDSGMPADHA